MLPETHENRLRAIGANDDVINYIDMNFKPIDAGSVSNGMTHAQLDIIRKVVCECRGIPVVDLSRKSRKRELVMTRQMCHYLSLKYTTATLSVIGRFCGNVDHATILHSKKTMMDLMFSDKVFVDYFQRIEYKVVNSLLAIEKKGDVDNRMIKFIQKHK